MPNKKAFSFKKYFSLFQLKSEKFMFSKWVDDR